MLGQDRSVLRLSGEIHHFSGIALEVEQRFALIPGVIGAVLEARAPDHPPRELRGASINRPPLRHPVFGHDIPARVGGFRIQRARLQAPARQPVWSLDAGELAQRREEVDAGIDQPI